MSIFQHLEFVNPLLVDFIATTTSIVHERQRPTLFHNLLADLVEVCAGSRQLLVVLKRLGYVSSPDTHDRFVTQHAENARQTAIWDHLPKDVFTVTSVDNFDMLQSYAAVYCGDQ